jgi:cupin 2 domain-containing protein
MKESESAMLVLSRKKNESIVINDEITVVVVEIRGDKVRLGIEAPKEIVPHRPEACETTKGMDREKQAMETANLLDHLPADLPKELFTTIIQTAGIRVERIVSHGHASPPGFWFDQEENELVIVLEGSAIVQFEGDTEPMELRKGSYLNIPAHARHRVASTEPNLKTIWLAIHYRG